MRVRFPQGAYFSNKRTYKLSLIILYMKINTKKDYWILILIAILILALANSLSFKYTGYLIKEISRDHCSDNSEDNRCICKEDEIKVRLDRGYSCFVIECEKNSDCAIKSQSNEYICNKPDTTKPQSGYCACTDC